MISREMAEKMIRAALKARKNAYAPYSHFKVGAALLTVDGDIYTGCNIENAAYGPSNCAERTAFFKAVSEGERAFAAIAVTGAPEGEKADRYCAPCGVCRQVMAEFCQPTSFEIIVAKSEEEYYIKTLQELLPENFGPMNLQN